MKKVNICLLPILLIFFTISIVKAENSRPVKEVYYGATLFEVYPEGAVPISDTLPRKLHCTNKICKMFIGAQETPNTFRDKRCNKVRKEGKTTVFHCLKKTVWVVYTEISKEEYAQALLLLYM